MNFCYFASVHPSLHSYRSFSRRAQSPRVFQKSPLGVQNVHIGIYSQMNPDLLSGNSIQNSYLVHEASGPFVRNPIPSLRRRREGGSEGERASEGARRDREREIGVEQFRSPTVRVLGNPVFSREFSCLGICLFGRFSFYWSRIGVVWKEWRSFEDLRRIWRLFDRSLQLTGSFYRRKLGFILLHTFLGIGSLVIIMCSC
jgi:hypothetical protein